MKKKVYAMLLLCGLALGAFSFSYNPDTWSSCMGTDAAYLDGAPATPMGYCNDIGTEMRDGQEVNVLKCEANGNGSPLGGGVCTGNYIHPMPL